MLTDVPKEPADDGDVDPLPKMFIRLLPKFDDNELLPKFDEILFPIPDENLEFILEDWLFWWPKKPFVRLGGCCPLVLFSPKLELLLLWSPVEN